MEFLRIHAQKEGRASSWVVPFLSEVGGRRCGEEVRTRLQGLEVDVTFSVESADGVVLGSDYLVSEIRRDLGR